jgi:hypothetical protein
LKRGLVLSLLPAIHKRELAKIWLLWYYKCFNAYYLI